MLSRQSQKDLETIKPPRHRRQSTLQPQKAITKKGKRKVLDSTQLHLFQGILRNFYTTNFFLFSNIGWGNFLSSTQQQIPTKRIVHNVQNVWHCKKNTFFQPSHLKSILYVSTFVNINREVTVTFKTRKLKSKTKEY